MNTMNSNDNIADITDIIDITDRYSRKYKNYSDTYWGLGIENETYIEFDKKIPLKGSYISQNISRERYSVNYPLSYNKDDIAVLTKIFEPDRTYHVSHMMNSHCFDKLDLNQNHKTTYSMRPFPNPKYSGKSFFEEWEKFDPEISKMISLTDKYHFNVFIDGDAIEFITNNFFNAKIEDIVIELGELKNDFIQRLQKFLTQKNVFTYGNVGFPYINPGFNMFMTQKNGVVLFNNSTYHINITLPTKLLNGKIQNKKKFVNDHSKAIALIQWFEPLYICTLGSPDIFAIISNLQGNELSYTEGSMRCAISRYIGVGTYNVNIMEVGRILTKPLREVKPISSVWWRDLIEKKFNYMLPKDQVGLDFNFNKHYQSGFEFRLLDGFPLIYMNAVIQSLVLICAHSLSVGLDFFDVASENHIWNNIVYKSLAYGHNAIITEYEKEELLKKIKLNIQLKGHKLDDIYFQIIEELFNKYRNSQVVKSFCNSISEPPVWDNFNKIQHLAHLEFINQK